MGSSVKQTKKIVVTVIGKDRVGIVARVATTLSQRSVNIEDINQKILGGEIFAMTMLCDMGRSRLDLPELSAELQKTVDDMGLKVTVQDVELYRYMHRV